MYYVTQILPFNVVMVAAVVWFFRHGFGDR